MKDLLLPLGKIMDTSALKPVSKGLQLAFRYTLPPLLNSTVAKTAFPKPIKAKVFLRGSLVDSESYNPLFSDWDLGVCLDTESCETHSHEITHFVEMIHSIKRVVPALGEIETYSQTEYAELHKLILIYGKTYHDFRALRKLRWIEKAQNESLSRGDGQSKYQFEKSIRAKKLCLAKIGLDPVSANRPDCWTVAIRKTLENVRTRHDLTVEGRPPSVQEGPPAGPLYQAYLDLNLQSRQLSSADVLDLFALLPPFATPEPIRAAVHMRRSHRAVFELVRALTRIEVLVVSAAMRSFIAPRPGYEEWVTILQNSFLELEKPLEPDLG